MINFLAKVGLCMEDWRRIMNKTTLIFLIVFSLSLFLATAAVSIEVPGEVTGNEIITISVKGCSQISLLQLNTANTLGSTLKLVDQGTGDWSTTYNTISDVSTGKYRVDVSCEDGSAATKEFCVDSPGCIPPVTLPNTGGGTYCSSSWSCSSWTLCNASLKQTRTCYDSNNCKQNKVEIKDCDQCQESWICSLWASCSSNVQKRTCIDQHFCGTTFVKPLESKNCNQVTVGGSQPAYTTNDIPPPGTPPAVQPGFSFNQVWDKYGTYILIGGIAFILIIIAVLLIAHFVKPQRLAYNHDELVGWINRERAMGTSDEEVRNILSNKTGWNEEEISEAFSTLSKPKLPSFPPQGNVTTA
jgi:hypothetical protein